LKTINRQKALKRICRPEFILLIGAAATTFAWFFLTLPTPLKEADQLVNTASLLLILAAYLFYDFRPDFADDGKTGLGFAGWAGAGILFLGSVFIFRGPLFLVFGLFVGSCCFLRGAGGVLLDPSGRRLLNSLFITFTLFGLLLVSLPLVDMPLRITAGKWSAHILDWFHNDTELGFVSRDGVPMLLLIVNERPFHVAAECNGFGLLGTSLLLTCAFVIYRRIAVIDTFLLLLSAAFIAVIGNLVRILIIINLAPLVGDHYHLMHEIVGSITFYAFLALQGWLTIGFGKSPRPEDQSIEA